MTADTILGSSEHGIRAKTADQSSGAPYLKRVWLDPARVGDENSYPFSLPFLRGGFDLAFDSAITIIVGENGTGKSTLLEAIAALSGYDQAGGGKGYMPTDHSGAIDPADHHIRTLLRAADVKWCDCR